MDSSFVYTCRKYPSNSVHSTHRLGTASRGGHGVEKEDEWAVQIIREMGIYIYISLDYMVIEVRIERKKAGVNSRVQIE